MIKLDDIALHSENTQSTYKQGMRTYERKFNGPMPPVPSDLVRFIEWCLNYDIKPSTVRLYIASIKHYLKKLGYVDVTQDEVVKNALRKSTRLSNAPVKQAEILMVDELCQLDSYCLGEIARATKSEDKKRLFQISRDYAYVCLAFWRGFRSDSMCQLNVEDLKLDDDYPYVQVSDKTHDKKHWPLPKKTQFLDSVRALQYYLDISKLKQGPLFRGVSRWGDIKSNRMGIDSFNPILQKLVNDAAIDKHITSHSFRRTLATLLAAKGIDTVRIMKWIGWRDHATVVRYVDDALLKEFSDSLYELGQDDLATNEDANLRLFRTN